MVDVGVGGQAHVQQRPGPLLRHVADPEDVAVGDVPHGAVHVAQPGGAQAHGLDGAAGLTGVDDVADPVLVLDQHEGPRDEVLDQALRAEAEGNPGDAGAGDQQAEGDAQLAQDHDAGDGPHDDGGCRPQQVDRVVARAADLSDSGPWDCSASGAWRRRRWIRSWASGLAIRSVNRRIAPEEAVGHPGHDHDQQDVGGLRH